MSYFCCEILALQHAVLILAANRNLNQSGSSHGSISNQDSSCHNIWCVCQTQAFSAFNIAKETQPSLIWSLAMMKNAKRPVFSQRSLVSTCICALSSVLAIEVIWIASQMLGQDIALGHVPVLPAICLGAGLLDERDKPWVGENVQSFSSGK